VLLIITGIMSIIDSIWAFSYNGTVVDKLHGALLGHSLTTYAVVWLIVGITIYTLLVHFHEKVTTN
jgi:hypothetical protein